jgi:hypothetical protein
MFLGRASVSPLLLIVMPVLTVVVARGDVPWSAATAVLPEVPVFQAPLLY